MSYVQSRLALNWGAAFANESIVLSAKEPTSSVQLTLEDFVGMI